MSKQYLAQHSIDDAHPSEIFAVAATPTQILSGSGSTSIKIHSTTNDDFEVSQVLKDAHKLGCHHLTISANYKIAVSVGFGGEAKIWRFEDGIWKHAADIEAAKKAGEVWAVALDAEGRYLVGTTYDGRVNVWDLNTGENASTPKKFTEWETKGSFGMCCDLSPDGRFTATGHDSGNIYLFSTATTRLLHSLPTQGKSVRSVRFSPGSTRLAAAGDSRVISLYDTNSGEQVANLTGHDGWITSLDWSHTGEYLLSGSVDGKVKVWSIETRRCVATHSESDKGLWAVRWLPKGETGPERAKAERFVTGGDNRSISIYREASGAS